MSASNIPSRGFGLADGPFDGPPAWRLNIQVVDWVVTAADSFMDSEEVATAVAEGMILPQDREHLEEMAKEEVVTYALALSVRVSLVPFSSSPFFFFFLSFF